MIKGLLVFLGFILVLMIIGLCCVDEGMQGAGIKAKDDLSELQGQMR